MKNLHAFFMASLLLLCTGFGTDAQNRQLPTSLRTASAILPQAVSPQLNGTQSSIRVPQTEIEYAWSEQEEWVPLFERAYEYDNKGRRTQQVTKDLTEGKKLNLALHQYDAQGRDTLLVMQVPLNGGWVNSYRSRTKYNTHGQIVYTAVFGWQQEAWHLQSATRINYTYGPANRIDQIVTQQYEGNNWTDLKKEVYDYTVSNTLPDRKTIYTSTETGWSPTQRYTSIAYYPENQQEQSYVLQTWNNTDWQSVSQHAFTYSTNSTTQANIVEEEVYRYNGSSTLLEKKILDEYLPNGQFMQHKVEILVNGQWLVDTENSLIGHGILEPEGGDFTEFIYQTFSYTPQGQLRYDNLLKHTFSDFINITVTSAAEEIMARAVSVYPNPAKDVLYIALDAATIQEASLSIRNLTEQKVYELDSIRGEATINLSHLAGGIYLVNVQGTNSTVVTRKIIIQ